MTTPSKKVRKARRRTAATNPETDERAFAGWGSDSIDVTDRTETPVLRFTPTAWAKLRCFRDAGETEVGGFGLTDPDDALRVVDFLTLPQTCTAVTVKFDDDAVADLLDRQVDAGHTPQQVLRVWCHTHPGDCPHPSGTDEATFDRSFGRCDWAVMFILACGGDTYARLRFTASPVGPAAQIEIPVAIDYDAAFRGSDFDAWRDEYDRHVTEEVVASVAFNTKAHHAGDADASAGVDADDLADCLADLDLWEEQAWQDYVAACETGE